MLPGLIVEHRSKTKSWMKRILRNMLYRGSEIMRQVGWVVFDEIHYMREKERGVVWEESLILLPDNVHYVFLSATIPNARQFVEWVAHLHNQPCHAVYMEYRPVPLQHYIFPAGGTWIHLIVDDKVQNLEKERLEYGQNISKLKSSNDKQQQDIIDLQSQTSELESLRVQLQYEEERLAASQSEVERLQESNAELQEDMPACGERKAELLEFTQKLTDKNVRLQYESSDMEAKAEEYEQSSIAVYPSRILKREVEENQYFPFIVNLKVISRTPSQKEQVFESENLSSEVNRQTQTQTHEEMQCTTEEIFITEENTNKSVKMNLKKYAGYVCFVVILLGMHILKCSPYKIFLIFISNTNIAAAAKPIPAPLLYAWLKEMIGASIGVATYVFYGYWIAKNEESSKRENQSDDDTMEDAIKDKENIANVPALKDLLWTGAFIFVFVYASYKTINWLFTKKEREPPRGDVVINNQNLVVPRPDLNRRLL